MTILGRHGFDLKFNALKTATALATVLGILMIVSLGFLMRTILSAVHKKEAKTFRSAPAAPVSSGPASLQQYEALLHHNPFGLSAGTLKNVPAGPEPTPAADVRLVGTISGRMKHGYAIFLGNDGRQTMLRTGEAVPGIGELVRVGKNQAWLRRNGKATGIPMVQVGLLDGPESARGPGMAAGPVRLLGKGDFIIDQRAIQYAVDNPAQIIMDAKLTPNMVKDRQEGFLMREVRKQGIYDSLGLQNGDVLLQINGMNISNPENALQAFTALRGMDRVQLDIIRNNNRMTMNYQIR